MMRLQRSDVKHELTVTATRIVAFASAPLAKVAGQAFAGLDGIPHRVYRGPVPIHATHFTSAFVLVVRAEILRTGHQYVTDFRAEKRVSYFV
jgi:hypothetical protein